MSRRRARQRHPTTRGIGEEANDDPMNRLVAPIVSRPPGASGAPLSFSLVLHPLNGIEVSMPLLFAHHDMLDSLDFLRLRPMSPAEHLLAFAVYAVLAVGVVRAGLFGLGWAREAAARRRLRDSEEEAHRPSYVGERP
jgi:hypothetical protein